MEASQVALQVVGRVRAHKGPIDGLYFYETTSGVEHCNTTLNKNGFYIFTTRGQWPIEITHEVEREVAHHTLDGTQNPNKYWETFKQLCILIHRDPEDM